jgi:thiol oxidase
MGYPTVRYFEPHPDPTNIGVNFVAYNNPELMKNNLIEKLSETQRNGNLSSLCDIQPYDKDNIVLDSNNLLTFVIIESTTNNRLAQELIIDFCRVKNVKIIYALNSNTKLVDLLDSKIYPSLYKVDSYNHFQLLVNNNNKSFYIESINKNLEAEHITPFNIIDITTKLYNMIFKNEKVLLEYNIVYLSDLEATLKYSLDHEITSRSIISGEALESLIGYLELLSECFPTNIRGKKFINLLLDSIRDKKTVSGENLGEYVNKYEFLISPYVTKHKWIGCQGSNAMFRQYPCGLWTLFHTLTVQASMKNLDTFNGIQVLETIAGYVKHFFGCTDCSEHFMGMVTTIKNNVSSFDDAVLWLWSAHNQVNQRLAGDVTEDPMFPKVLFPIKRHCETCRNNVTNEWNKSEVLAFLKKMYSTVSNKQASNVIKPQNMLSAQQTIEESNFNDIFDKEEWKIDVSTCMISYILSCSVLMILFYVLVIKKRCKKNKYFYFVLSKV